MVKANLLGVYNNLPLRAILTLDVDGVEIGASVLALPGKKWELIMHQQGKMFLPTVFQSVEIEAAVLSAIDKYNKVNIAYESSKRGNVNV